jgi:hypothetical protein
MSKNSDKSDRKKLLQRHVIFDEVSEKKEDLTNNVLNMLASFT